MPPSHRRRRRLAPVALTGTPGTGKSAVARRLAPRFRSIEVGTLAIERGAGRRSGARSTTVHLARLTALLRREPAHADIVVGHLAHLLPIRDTIVLRCHPLELGRRLQRARRGSVRDRAANVVAEATDAILIEAIELGRRVWEIDTTGLGVDAVARRVAARIGRRGPSRYGRVDWLADPAVTEELLRLGP